MTGPEHYRTAERLLDGIKTRGGAVVVEDGTAEVVATAQVHATLALAAATVLGARMGYGLGPLDGEEWDPVTDPKRGGR